MDTIDAAWLAGFLDGEGSFMVTKGTRYGFVSWVPTIAATSTDERALLECKRLAGGKISQPIQPSGNAKKARIWTLKGLRLDDVLAAVRPHLRIKAEQAALVALLRSEIKCWSCARSSQSGSREAVHERRENIRLAVRALNHRGVLPLPPEQTKALDWSRCLVGSGK